MVLTCENLSRVNTRAGILTAVTLSWLHSHPQIASLWHTTSSRMCVHTEYVSIRGLKALPKLKKTLESPKDIQCLFRFS